MARLVITETEILQALENAVAPEPKEARTVQDLMKLTGFGMNKIRQALGHIAMQDRLEVVQVKRPGVDKRQISRPAYVILPAKKGKRA